MEISHSSDRQTLAESDPGGKSSYWFYMGRMDPKRLKALRNDLVAALAAEGALKNPRSGPYVLSAGNAEPAS